LTVRANAPQAPPALRAPTTPQGRIALALWIANQDHTAWRLEGYRSLLPLIKSGDALARMLGDAALDTGEQQLFVSGAGNP
jgi:hypothetical protein